MWLVGQAVKTSASHADNTGSNPVRVTIITLFILAGAYCDEVPPVPIPNTEVKLICAEDTWREAAWENRAVPAYIFFTRVSRIKS